jgi:hypothetical protein
MRSQGVPEAGVGVVHYPCGPYRSTVSDAAIRLKTRTPAMSCWSVVASHHRLPFRPALPLPFFPTPSFQAFHARSNRLRGP